MTLTVEVDFLITPSLIAQKISRKNQTKKVSHDVCAKKRISLPWTMFELHNFDDQSLMEMLAEYTAEYTNLLTNPTTPEELAYVKQLVKNIFDEIEIRKAALAANTTISSKHISLSKK